MIPADVRSVIAALALAHSRGSSVTGLYDHAAAQHLNLTASASGTLVNAVHLDRKSKFSGAIPNVFDHVRNSYVHLTGVGGEYTAYDHATETHLTIRITDNVAAVYDHTAEAWVQFTA